MYLNFHSFFVCDYRGHSSVFIMICMVSVCEYLEGSWAFTLNSIVFVCEGLVG